MFSQQRLHSSKLLLDGGLGRSGVCPEASWTLKVFYRRIEGLLRGFLGCTSVNQTQQLCKQAVNACQMNIYVAAATATVVSLTFLSRSAERCRGNERLLIAHYLHLIDELQNRRLGNSSLAV